MTNDNIFTALNTNSTMEKKIVEAENKNTDSHNQTRTKVAEAYLNVAKEAKTPEEKERLVDKASQEVDKIADESAKARKVNDKHSNRAVTALLGVLTGAVVIGITRQFPQVKEFAEKQLSNLLPGSKKS